MLQVPSTPHTRNPCWLRRGEPRAVSPQTGSFPTRRCCACRGLWVAVVCCGFCCSAGWVAVQPGRDLRPRGWLSGREWRAQAAAGCGLPAYCAHNASRTNARLAFGPVSTVECRRSRRVVTARTPADERNSFWEEQCLGPHHSQLTGRVTRWRDCSRSSKQPSYNASVVRHCSLTCCVCVAINFCPALPSSQCLQCSASIQPIDSMHMCLCVSITTFSLHHYLEILPPHQLPSALRSPCLPPLP